MKKLASGGMAEVWLGRESGLIDRYVVVKRILPHLEALPEFIRMFQNEARIAARFNHPNIAQIYEVGADGDIHFISMEYVHGEDLGRVMRKAWSQDRWVARGLALRIIADACEGLYYAHTKLDEEGRPLHVVHRDVSPQNLLVGFDGSVKLVDFGIAKMADTASHTRAGAVKGKFSYMSPEQAEGKPLDARSDVFSMGLVLYELLTGIRPLKRDSEMLTLQAVSECKILPPSEIAEIPADVDALVMPALQKRREERYPDARAFKRALEEYCVRQQWLVGSVQISELMQLLFAERIEEERRTGRPYLDRAEHLASEVAAPLIRAPEAAERTGAPKATGIRQRITQPLASTVLEDAGETGAAPLTGAPRGGQSVRTEERPAPANSMSRVMAAQTKGGTQLGLSRRSNSSMMPEAPPPMLRDTDIADASPSVSVGSEANVAAVQPSVPASSTFVPAPSATRRVPEVSAPAVKKSGGLGWLLVALAAGAVATVFVFSPLAGWLRGPPKDIFLTVEASEPVDIRLEPSASSGSAREPARMLGPAPLRKVPGVKPGDAIVYVNPQLGIEFRQLIPAADPGAVVTLKKEFEVQEVQLRFRPMPAGKVEIFRGGRLVGTVPGPKMGFFEGIHSLEVRGAGLTQPKAFDIHVQDNTSNHFVVDMTDVLLESATEKAPASAPTKRGSKRKTR